MAKILPWSLPTRPKKTAKIEIEPEYKGISMEGNQLISVQLDSEVMPSPQALTASGTSSKTTINSLPLKKYAT